MAHWWTIEVFAVDCRAIRKISSWFKKVLFQLYLLDNWQNWGLRCADLFCRNQGENRSSRAKDLFFSEIWEKIALPEVMTFFLRSGQWLSKQSWLESEDLFLFWGGVPESYFPIAVVRREWAMQTFKTQKMGHGSEKVENHWPKPSSLIDSCNAELIIAKSTASFS